MRLLQYGSAWGVPSLATDCTKAQAWLRFCGVEFELEDCMAAQAAWIQSLPALEVGSRLLHLSPPCRRGAGRGR